MLIASIIRKMYSPTIVHVLPLSPLESSEPYFAPPPPHTPPTQSLATGLKAEPEKKRTAERERYQVYPEKKQTAERERYQADPEKKRSAKRKRYWESPECARLAKRVRYWKAKRSTVQNQRGHRKSTTDKGIQRYVNVVTFSYLRY